MYSDSDSELDSVEFLNFLKHNESALNITYSNTLESNLLLRCCKLRQNGDRNKSKYVVFFGFRCDGRRVSASDPCAWTL